MAATSMSDTTLHVITACSVALLMSCGIGTAAARGHHDDNNRGDRQTESRDSNGSSTFNSDRHKRKSIVPTHRAPVLNGNIPTLPVHGSPPLTGPTRPSKIVRDHRAPGPGRHHHQPICRQASNHTWPAGCYGEGGLWGSTKPASPPYGGPPQGGKVRDHRSAQ